MKFGKTLSTHYRKDLNQIEIHKSLFGIKYYLYSNKKGWGRHSLFFKKRKRNFAGLEMLWATSRLNYLMEQDPFMDSKTIDSNFNKLLKQAGEQHLKDDVLKDSDFTSKNPFTVNQPDNGEIRNEELYPNNAKKLRVPTGHGKPWHLVDVVC